MSDPQPDRPLDRLPDRLLVPDVELDCREMRCPLPVIELAKHLHDVPVGGLLAVVTGDPAARVDVPAWCRMKGQDFVGEDAAADGLPRYVVRRRS